MTCLVWYFAIILLVDVDLHEAREAVFFDGVVKVFAEEGIQPDFINYIEEYFANSSAKRFDIVRMVDARVCSKSNAFATTDLTASNRITIFFSRQNFKWCILLLNNGAVVQFYENHPNRMAAHVAVPGQGTSSIDFDKDTWQTELRSMLDEICLSMSGKIRRKRDVEKVDDRRNEDESSISKTPAADEFVKKMNDVASFCVKIDERGTKKHDDAKGVPGKPLDKTVPPNEKPIELEVLLAELQSEILPMFEERPPIRAHGFYPGVQSKTDIIVSTLCDTLASQGNITDGCHAMNELEMLSTNWVGKAMGLPKQFLFETDSDGGGMILNTTTYGMFTAMVAAYQRKLHEMQSANAEAKKAGVQASGIKKMISYGCQEAHFSFDIGCRLAKVDCKLITPDTDGTIDVEELKREISVRYFIADGDVSNGKAPAFINVTLGSAQACTFDKLSEVVKVAKQYGIWVHVDASYAGNYFVCEQYRGRLMGIEDAHSICVNLHKCLTQCCTEAFFWTVDYKVVKRTTPIVTNMLRALHADGSCHELATAASNRYKALKTYIWFKLSGLEGLREYIRSVSAMTSRFRQHMSVDGRLIDKTCAPDYGFIVFSCQGEQANELTYRFCSHIIRSGKMAVSLVSSNRSTMIRLAFNREHFTQAEVDESWNMLRQLLDEWQSEEKKGNIISNIECARLIHEGNAGVMGPPSMSLESIGACSSLNTPVAMAETASKEKAKEREPIISPVDSSKKDEAVETDKKAQKAVVGKLHERAKTAEPPSTATAKYPDYVIKRKTGEEREAEESASKKRSKEISLKKEAREKEPKKSVNESSSKKEAKKVSSKKSAKGISSEREDKETSSKKEDKDVSSKEEINEAPSKKEAKESSSTKGDKEFSSRKMDNVGEKDDDDEKSEGISNREAEDEYNKVESESTSESSSSTTQKRKLLQQKRKMEKASTARSRRTARTGKRDHKKASGGHFCFFMMNAFVINEEMDVPPTAAEETTVATSAHSRIKLDPPDCMEGVGPDFEPQTTIDDEYGGMPAVIYDAIVRYKKRDRTRRSVTKGWIAVLMRIGGILLHPHFESTNVAIFPLISYHIQHEMRCIRFILSWSDGETLLYYNDRSGSNETPRFVVKKGEVRSILQRVHEMIGHLGMKRTQYAVLRHLYWRSVRADVRKFINSCDFCTKKKNDGKKLFKASFDILGDKVDVEVALRPVEERFQYADRFLLTLIGLDEQTVKQHPQTQLVSYTFRNITHNDRHNNVTIINKDLPGARRKHLKRPPIRSFCGGANVTHQVSHSCRYVEVKELNRGTMEVPNATYGSLRYSDNKMTPSIGFQRSAPTFRLDGDVDAFSHDEQAFKAAEPNLRNTGKYTATYTNTPKATSIYDEEVSSHTRKKILKEVPVGRKERIDDGVIIYEDDILRSVVEPTHPSHCRFPIISRRIRHKRNTQTSSADSLLLRSKGFNAHTASASTSRLLSDSDSVLTSYDAARHRPSLIGLAPVILMPSSDPEVVQLQKEVLQRQKSIQILQEKVLRAQFERLRAARLKGEEESSIMSRE
uniref:Integrase zinc-binding domain-containing protein n=1 Tax=Ascaris lumbricoides TaxID=6252 RepID=A0A9J2PCU0_ASCLU